MSLLTLYGEMQDTYLALIRAFPLRPIRSEGELDEAMEILDTLVVKETLTAAEADYLIGSHEGPQAGKSIQPTHKTTWGQ